MPAPDLLAANDLGGPDPGGTPASFTDDTTDAAVQTPGPTMPAALPPPAPIQNGPGVWDSIRQALPLVAAGIAARVGGPLAGAGLLQGLTQAQQQKRLELEKQAALQQAYTHQRTDDAIRLMQQASEQQQRQATFVQNAIKELNGIDDPVQFAATAKLFDDTAARVFGTDPGTIAKAVSFDNTKALAKTKAEAQTVLDRVGKQFAGPDDPTGAQFIAQHPDYTVTFRGKPTKFSDLQAVVGVDVIDASGKGVVPNAPLPAAVSDAKSAAQSALVQEAQRRKSAGLPPMTPAEAAKISADAAQGFEATLAGKRTAAEAANKPAVLTTGVTAPGSPTPEMHGADYLKTLPSATADTIKALADGRMAFPTGAALRDPKWSALVQGVMQYDPSFDEAMASQNARQKTRVDFTTGKSAQTINALNTVAGHLAELQAQGAALGNTDFDSYNTIKNWLKTRIGLPEATNFNTTKQAVADELTRVYRQAGGSEADVQGWKNAINASQSPAQLAGNFATVGKLIQSKLDALDAQYKQGMGTSAVSIVSPSARQAIDRLQGVASGGTGAGGGTASPQRTLTYGGKPVVQTQQPDGTWTDAQGWVYNAAGVRIR